MLFRSFSATLTPEQWNVVLYALRKHAMPWEISAPIINALSEQFGRQAQSQPPPPLSPDETPGEYAALHNVETAEGWTASGTRQRGNVPGRNEVGLGRFHSE